MADSTGRELTFGRALVASVLLSRAIQSRALTDTTIGLLLPASVGGALANITVSLAGNVPVNLNFTAGRDSVTAALDRCGISMILTSQTFLAKAGLAAMPGMVFLEDLLQGASALSKIVTLVAARLFPAPLVEHLFLRDPAANALATVIFSSGSTGVPRVSASPSSAPSGCASRSPQHSSSGSGWT